MKYPVVPMQTCIQVAAEFAKTGHRSLTDDEVQLSGSGPELDLEPINELAQCLQDQLVEHVDKHGDSDRDLFEGRVAGDVHRTLRDLETLVLDDPGFWRYLSLGYFWWLVRWREEGTFADADPAKYLKYVDGTRPTECVLLRTFLRGQAIRDDDDYTLASSIEEGADFWRSHVLRVTIGAVPAVSRAFAREQRDERMPTTVLRAYARRLNRISTNVVLPLLDEDEATDLVEELRQ